MNIQVLGLGFQVLGLGARYSFATVLITESALLAVGATDFPGMAFCLQSLRVFG